ncbi:MAG: hypothetical protein M1521_02965 [Thermotogae bacterium]|nr:hypothetical protein [Thermotogota bacterium]
MSTPNISGTWMLTMIISANGQSNTSPITISQSGNSITVNLSGVNLAGTISGNSINFSGYQNDNGQYVVVNFCIKSCVK